MFVDIIRNQSESSALRLTAEVRQSWGFQCAQCGHEKPFTAPGSISTGYGSDCCGNLFCYDCIAKRDREELKDRTRPFVCYVNADGEHVSNWPGAILGTVHSYGQSRAGWNGATIARFHVRDILGQWWIGRGAGRGMCCTLRPMKHVPEYARKWGQ